jgi:aryl-alcohol dehydrogenase-like predicted oxidoreductase
LQTDYIDVYQLHDPPAEVLLHGDFVEPLERLRRQGKIRHWGVAVRRPEDVPDALTYRLLTSIQVGLSVLEQAALDTAIPRAAARDVAVIARQVYASGLLTRAVDRLDVAELDTEPAVAARKREQLARYAMIAERYGRSRAEMALQFALAREEVSVVLLGISRADQLAASLRALDAPALSADERHLLTASRRPGR